MPLKYRILIVAGILILDLALFFLPLCAFFLAYAILVNPPWFRDFLNESARISGEPGS